MDQDIKKLDQQLGILVAKLKEELVGIRTNRPTPKLVEDIRVDYFGQMMTVKQLGSISINPPREIVISVWDRNAVTSVAKAIEGVHMGLSIAVDGGAVRINLPPLTDQRRKELIKLVHSLTEKQRIAVRLIRDEVRKKIKANIDEDAVHFFEKKMQEVVDKTNKSIEDILKLKEKEISE